MTDTAPLTTVHLVTLGCARNEVDSEELAARLEAGGFRLVDDPEEAEAVMVNTCGFVEQASAMPRSSHGPPPRVAQPPP